VLDGLCGGEQPGVERRLSLVFVHDLGAFVENILDRIALLAASRLSEKFEDLLEAFDLTFGFVVMLFEGRAKLIGGRRPSPSSGALCKSAFRRTRYLSACPRTARSNLWRP
jgi:hypothetical protein